MPDAEPKQGVISPDTLRSASRRSSETPNSPWGSPGIRCVHTPPLKRGCHQHPAIRFLQPDGTTWQRPASFHPLYLGGLLASLPGRGHAIPAGRPAEGLVRFLRRKDNGKSEGCISVSFSVIPPAGQLHCQHSTYLEIRDVSKPRFRVSPPNQRQTRSRLCPEGSEPPSSRGPDTLHCPAP